MLHGLNALQRAQMFHVMCCKSVASLQFDDDESVAGARTAFWQRPKFWRILVPILVSAGLAAAAIALLITHPDKASL